MAKLTAATRKKLPTKVFGLPEKRAYPLEDASHARNALSRAAQNATPGQQAQIKQKVGAMYPGMQMKPLSSMAA